MMSEAFGNVYFGNLVVSGHKKMTPRIHMGVSINGNSPKMDGL
jgi:hypothetical protein